MLPLKSVAVACLLSGAVLGCTQNTDGQMRSSAQVTPDVTLQSHGWKLQQMRDADGQVNAQWRSLSTDKHAPLEMQFSDAKTVALLNLCNNMHGSYEEQGHDLKISRMVSTMMICNDEQMMSFEQNVAQQLPHVQSWKISEASTEPVLSLMFQGGVVWEFKGEPTYETLYGPSEQIFLEVASEKVPCSSPLIENAQCLKVRDISYDSQGIKQSIGEWSNYYGSIEGYTKEPNVRNILRIKRYSNPNAPADASKYVDVLDLVVESESKE